MSDFIYGFSLGILTSVLTLILAVTIMSFLKKEPIIRHFSNGKRLGRTHKLSDWLGCKYCNFKNPREDSK